MRLAIIRRALVATAALTLLSIPVVSAESVGADRDLLTAGNQADYPLGTVQPSAEVPLDVWFVLTCTGTSHVDSTQAIRLTLGTRLIPAGGGFHAGGLTFGLGSDWPADGQDCPAGLPPTIGGPLHMSVIAPADPGHYNYRFSWNRAVTPLGNNDSSVFSGTPLPTITVSLDVAGSTPPPNTPPTLHLPSAMTVEGNTTGGATVSYAATATDAEDAVAPTPTCSPASGSKFALGPTTVHCSATDGGGLTTTGTFSVTVVDTTAPSLSGMPGDRTLTTSDPSGATLTYVAPTATDVVDASPSVGCNWASGSKIPVGDTTVTCTATDGSGNSTSASFVAHVLLAQASWEDPASGGLVVNGARTVPIKVSLMLGGQLVTTGSANVRVVPCGGGAGVASAPLELQSNGRWMGHLSTDGLAVGCYRVVACANGVAIGSFEMDVRGDIAPAAAKPARNNPKK
jgi:hypothetical protein